MATESALGIRIRIVCCISCTESPPPWLDALLDGLKGKYNVNTTLIVENNCSGYTSWPYEIFSVPPGSKLNKLMAISTVLGDELVCLCDPDMTISVDNVVELIKTGATLLQSGNPCVVYGTVQSQAEQKMLSKLISIDKWFSHHIIRPLLWTSRLGISLPGQFLVLPSTIIKLIPHNVETYLDDLFIGLIARESGVQVLRSSKVVGTEAGRHSWTSLFLQRMRWMKGIFSLLPWCTIRPKSLGLLALHITAYHLFPIIFLAALVLLFSVAPVSCLAFIVLISLFIARASGQTISSVIVYILFFPLLHATTLALFWVPIHPLSLRKR